VSGESLKFDTAYRTPRYPAGHAHIHRFLYAITNEGKDIATAQAIYGVLYLGTLVTTCAIYRKAGGIPNWIVLLLPLSKRLHSIYALRLFNDCWAVFAAQLAILLFQYGVVDRGILLFRYVFRFQQSVVLTRPQVLLFPSRCPSFSISPDYSSSYSRGKAYCLPSLKSSTLLYSKVSLELDSSAKTLGHI